MPRMMICGHRAFKHKVKQLICFYYHKDIEDLTCALVSFLNLLNKLGKGEACQVFFLFFAMSLNSIIQEHE